MSPSEKPLPWTLDVVFGSVSAPCPTCGEASVLTLQTYEQAPGHPIACPRCGWQRAYGEEDRATVEAELRKHKFLYGMW